VPIDYYPNKSLEDLQTILSGLQDRQTVGFLSHASASGVMMSRTMTHAGTSKVETEILRVLWSMHVRAQSTPEAKNYPNPYAQKIRRTRPRYSGQAFS